MPTEYVALPSNATILNDYTLSLWPCLAWKKITRRADARPPTVFLPAEEFGRFDAEALATSRIVSSRVPHTSRTLRCVGLSAATER